MERPGTRRQCSALRDSFAGDRAKTNISGITEFGLVEITRRRVGKSLMELLQSPCEYCQGTGRTLASNVVSKKAREEIHRIARATDAATIRVTVHPEVARALAGEEEERRRRLEGKTRKAIAIEADERYHVEEIKISAE
jgi:ribonuclease G